MPELCRFYNIVIKMIFSDTDKHTTSRTFMFITTSTKPLLAWMAN